MKKFVLLIIGMVIMLNVSLLFVKSDDNKLCFSLSMVEAVAQKENENDDGWIIQHEECKSCNTRATNCVWEVSDGGGACTPADCSCGKVKGYKRI